MKSWVFDCEANGLTPDKFYCLAASDPQKGKVFVTPNYDNMRKILTEADILIGHNIQRWDIPNLERVLGIKVTAKLVDTLALSWYLYPERDRHGLDEWGEELGIKKPVITDWNDQTQEEYEHRCHEDVRINTLLWKKMYAYLMEIYGSNKEMWKLLDYLEFKMHCARLKEESRWKLDVKNVTDSKEELEKIQSEKKEALIAAMPAVPSVSIKTRPARFIKADGSYSKLGMEWIALLNDRGLPVSYEGEVEIVKGYELGNPSSTKQMKDWLYSLGWKPQTFKHTKNKTTGETKSIPQINLEFGKGICPSIKILYDKEPNLELLDGLSVLQHRIGILKGFLRDQEDGYVRAQIMGFTNTLRVIHTTVVNLPKVDKLYARPIRSSLIAKEGSLLCGADLSSLEDKLKQHFIYPYDPEYVREMSFDGYDPHLSLAVSAGAITQAQYDEYIWADRLTDAEKEVVDKVRINLAKSIKPIRDIFKNGNYACQYGAGAARIAITAGVDLKTAQGVHKAYWKKNWAIKKVASVQKYKTVNGQMWLFNPVNNIWYSLRFEKDIFSTLVQGTGSYLFDMWLKYILSKRSQLTGDFHDEFIILIKEAFRDKATSLINEAMTHINDTYKLNVPLGCNIQFGKKYSEIH